MSIADSHTGHATSTSYDDTQFAPGSFPRTANEARAQQPKQFRNKYGTMSIADSHDPNRPGYVTPSKKMVKMAIPALIFSILFPPPKQFRNKYGTMSIADSHDPNRPGYVTPSKKMVKMAIPALIFSILFPPLGLALGITTLVKINHEIKYHRIEPKGRTQAIIAIVISALFLMLMAMVIITTIQSPTYQQHLYYESI